MKKNPQEERKRVYEMIEFDNVYRNKGYQYIAGVDEAGRGPLAGPVYAAAVIFEDGVFIEGINDSKKLTEKRREELFDEIISKASAYSIACADAVMIDEMNILNATFHAMNRAVSELPLTPGYVIVDGNRIQGMTLPHETVVKGDQKSFSIAAASILAKVSRDRFMRKAAEQYPSYGFEKHKGYGTKAHYQAIRENGICEIHRKTFLKNGLDWGGK